MRFNTSSGETIVFLISVDTVSPDLHRISLLQILAGLKVHLIALAFPMPGSNRIISAGYH